MSSAAVFGGNFDPIHNGHLITAQRVLEFLKLEKLIFIPASVSPFKSEKKITHASDRLKMLELATEDLSGFSISETELERGGISYTVDTLRKLKDEFDNLYLIIGYDNLLEFTKWKDPDEIIQMATLVVLGRISMEPDSKQNRFFSAAVFPDTPIIEISSTEIRHRVKNNLPIDFLVPEKVKEYIYKNNLYKD